MAETNDPYEADASGWIATAAVLTADLERCVKAQSAEIERTGVIDQFWARATVRALFAYVEGSTFEMRRTLKKSNENGVLRLTLAEQAILAELTFELDDTGKPQSRPKFLPIDRNVRFVFQLFANAAHSNFKLDVGGEGWQHFLRALKVRNRITHPRDVQSLDLTREEVEATARAQIWYSSQVKAFIDTVPRGPNATATNPTTRTD